MSNTVKYISQDEVVDLVKSVPNGRLISVLFERAAAKCPVCGKSDRKWNGLEFCPNCGARLSKERESLCQFGIRNPQNTDIAPKGTGESAREAMADGRIKYYDPQVKNANGTVGGYRQCYAYNVKRMVINHVEYRVQQPVATTV